jgi:hypothetical protein
MTAPETSRTDAGAAAPTPPVPPPKGFARRHWGKLTLFTLLAVPVTVLGAWAAFTIFFVYSAGTRTGFSQKLSQKGWLCKTWEGELAMATVPGVMPEKFAFTVHSDSLAAAIQAMEGKRVTLRYEQHRFLPNSCFGETEYWATGVEEAPQ